MATVWDNLTKEKKEKLAKRYKKRFGKEFIPPGSDKPAIHIESKIESTEEIEKLMRQKPSYRRNR